MIEYSDLLRIYIRAMLGMVVAPLVLIVAVVAFLIGRACA